MIKAKLISEFAGSCFLTMIVLGSGIMAQNLFPGQTGAALLANSLATGAGLFVLIQSLGPVSGAHMNPAVTMVEVLWGRISKREGGLYVLSQFAGAYLGILIAHGMFDLPVFVVSEISRPGTNLWISEFIATFGLIGVIALSGKKHVEFAPLSVAAYITSAYWFTSSTAFANPSLSFARLFTNTFGGMAPEHYLPFCLSQLAGALTAWFFLRKI